MNEYVNKSEFYQPEDGWSRISQIAWSICIDWVQLLGIFPLGRIVEWACKEHGKNVETRAFGKQWEKERAQKKSDMIWFENNRGKCGIPTKLRDNSLTVYHPQFPTDDDKAFDDACPEERWALAITIGGHAVHYWVEDGNRLRTTGADLCPSIVSFKSTFRWTSEVFSSDGLSE